jgi:hypothetical protein
MSVFNSGMNHWQRKWLSDRLHKKGAETVTTPPTAIASPPLKRTPRKKKTAAQKK